MAMEFKIGDRIIGKDRQPFIIAEAGINHNGNLELAKRMIAAAKEAGVDAVKFQTFHADEFIRDETITYTYQSQGKEITEPMVEMFRRTEFSVDEWREIKRYCDELQIIFLSTPQNVSDLELLIQLGIEAIKVGSDDFVNLPLIRRYAKENLPMLLSCGMADGNEIRKTLQVVDAVGGKPVVLFLCTSQYPTPPEDVNVARLTSIGKEYPDVVPGFSDHTQGVEAAIMAMTLGARVFEKHFTMSHDLPGPDHWFSEDPSGLKQWSDAIRKAYRMLGFSELKPTESEIEMRKACHRSITALQTIKKGDVLSEDNLGMRRPGTGIPAAKWDEIIGRRASRNLMEGDQLSWEDVEGYGSQEIKRQESPDTKII